MIFFSLFSSLFRSLSLSQHLDENEQMTICSRKKNEKMGEYRGIPLFLSYFPFSDYYVTSER